MNCPQCFRGVLEVGGKTTMPISVHDVVKIVEVDVLICSLDECSHIQVSGPKNLLRTMKKEMRNEKFLPSKRISRQVGGS